MTSCCTADSLLDQHWASTVVAYGPRNKFTAKIHKTVRHTTNIEEIFRKSQVSYSDGS